MNWQDFPNLYREGHVDYITSHDDTRLRYARWPSLPDSKAIVVLVGGHREYMEKYTEFISDFLERGYAVYSMDNRGQGMSDRLLPNRLKSHCENFDLFSGDLNQFISQIVRSDARAGKLPFYLIGHSMGGHICLRYLHDYERHNYGGIFEKAVIMAPMIRFNLGNPVARTMAEAIIRLVCGIGLGANYALGQGSSFSRERHLIKQRFITHDDDRYAVEIDIFVSRPELYVGGATYGWLKAAMDSMNKINQAGFMAEIKLPVLTLLAEKEQLVDNQAIESLFSDCDNITIETIQGARHEIYRESDQYRDQMWQKIDEFLTIQ